MKLRSALPAAALLSALAPSLSSCTVESQSSSPGIPEDVRAIIFLQRAARNDGVGNVFDYTSYQPGARLVKLEPPSADGRLTTLTGDPMFAEADIMSWDLSFDAGTIVHRRPPQGRRPLPALPAERRRVQPAPDHRGAATTTCTRSSCPGNASCSRPPSRWRPGAKQFQDEYERQTTAQVGTINVDGSGEVLGPRNVSHRVAPALLPDGNVLYTEWRHLGDINDGHLRLMNTDMTGMREAFGGEERGVTNSYLKARHVDTLAGASGRDTFRVVTVATSRDNTLQAGKLLLVDLHEAERLSRGDRHDPPGAR